MLSPGDKIGPYTIRARAGQGGMAVVYQAWHEGLHRLEALKVPRGAGEIASDSAYIQRLLAEARVAAGLHHPHIAAIHGVSEPLAPIPFFAMEWVQGRDLAQIIAQNGAFSLGETVRILEKVALALDYAHGRGVVHRDIKPANILLSEENGTLVPKVVDFGISRAAEDDDLAGETKLTRSGMIVGTPEYMSPEQAGSGEKVDFRTDIYSLGIVAYEMLCGAPPFTANSGVSRLSILISQVRDPAPLWEKFPDFPSETGAAILAALAKFPADRPPSCADFIAQLQASVAQNGAFCVSKIEPQASLIDDAERTPFDATRFERDESAPIFERPISLSGPPPPGPPPPGPPPTLAPRKAPQTALEVPLESPTSADYAAFAPLGIEAQSRLESEVSAPNSTPARPKNDAVTVPNRENKSPKTGVLRGASRVVWMAGIGGILVGSSLVLALSGRNPSPSSTGVTPSGTGLESAVALPAETQPREAPREAVKEAVKATRLPSVVAPPLVKSAPPVAPPRLRTTSVIRTSPLPYATITRRSARRPLGSRLVVQPGQNGARQTTLQISYRGEQEMARRVVSQRVTRQPTEQIVVIGTRPMAPAPRLDPPAPAPALVRVRSARPAARKPARAVAPKRVARAQNAPPRAPAARPQKPAVAKKVTAKRRVVREAPLPP